MIRRNCTVRIRKLSALGVRTKTPNVCGAPYSALELPLLM